MGVMSVEPGVAVAQSRLTRSAAAPVFWAAVVGTWLSLLGAYVASVDWAATGKLIGAVQVLLLGATAVLWLNGLRYLSMWAAGPLVRASAPHRAELPEPSRASRVALAYCTADDFDPRALRASMRQTHPVATLILDDSASPSTMTAIDRFAHQTGAAVIRRSDRSGFKAGNLNHGISRILDEVDHIVVLDSDTVLPPDFVERALRAFAADPSVGIVQARNEADGRTAFAAAFAGLLGTHMAVTQSARGEVGLLAFTGRAAMISAECYRAAGPIPEVVGEDLAFSVETRAAGFRIRHLPDLVAREDYPVDYHAFRVQHAKTVQGATEFLLRSWRRVVRAPLRATEKADLLLDQLMLPSVALAGIALIVLNGVLAAAEFPAQPVWVSVVTLVLASAPLLPETLRQLRVHGAVRAFRFLALASALYGSTLLLTVSAATRVATGGRAVFRVTPKIAVPRTGFWTVRALRLELLAVGAAGIAAVAATGSLGPALPLAGTAAAALAFAFLGGARLRRAANSRPGALQ